MITHRVYNLYATDIMRKDLVFLTYESSFNDLSVLLQTSEHASYPLVDAPSKSIHSNAVLVNFVSFPQGLVS